MIAVVECSSAPTSRAVLDRLLAIGCILILLVAGCASESVNESEDATATSVAVADSSDTDDEADPQQSPGEGYTWDNPDPFDATFGPGAQVADLVRVLPLPDQLPSAWQPMDFADESDESSCTGTEPLAAIQAGWFVQPVDPNAVIPDVVIVNIEHHQTAGRAREAASMLGSDAWVACQETLFTGGQENGVALSSQNPAGESIDSVLLASRENVDARRQVVTARAFGSDFELVGDTHVWVEGQVLYAVSILAHGESNDELASTLEASMNAVGSVDERTIHDETTDDLRQAIERDDEAFAFFNRESRALFYPPLPDEFLDCANDTAAPVLAIMNGPVWLTQNRASLVIQGGFGFKDDAAAQAELDRFESVAESCVVERSAPLLGDIEVNQVTVNRTVIDGIEVVSVEADITQLASNPFVPSDLAVLAARTQAVSGSTVVGFGFVGIAGDEPDLVALTVAAVTRMEQ